MKKLVFLTVIFLSAASFAQVSINNPVINHDFPDPTVINVNGQYFAYATNSKAGGYRHIQLATSTDLQNWKEAGDALPQGASWAKSDFWAPHVSKLFTTSNVQLIRRTSSTTAIRQNKYSVI